MSYYIGIDPGITGAVCILIDQGSILDVLDLPVCAMTDKKKEIDVVKLSNILHDYIDFTDYIYLEHVHALPGNGTVSMFNFGMTYGSIKAVIRCLGFQIVNVSPMAWKNYMGLRKTEKKEVGNRVIEIYPHHADKFVTPRGRVIDGRCDATLIARYAYESENNLCLKL